MTSAHTAARLAWFTNKLGVALLVAALIRVRDGVPAALQALSDPPLASPAATWRTLSDVALYTAPLAFVAAGICRRLPGRGPVILAAVWGFAAPLCALLAIVGFIDIATARSSCYQPSLEPTPAMALFGKAAASSVSPRLLIAWVTVFPAVRLAIRVLAELASAPGLSRRTSVSGLAGALGIAVWFTLRPYSPITGDAVRASVACLAAAAAVVTSDFLFRRPPGRPAPRIDPVGATALTAGVAAALALPLLDPPDGYLNRWQLWLLPSYAIAFLVCASGRRRVH